MPGPHDIDGSRFGWREAGGAQPPIVCLHGLSGSRLAWEPQLQALSVDRQVLAWDMPGYGSSRPLAGPTNFPELADAVVALLDELDARQAHLVGLSFGGMIAQYTALAHPERVLSLSLLSTSSAFGLNGTRPEDWRAARLAPLDAGHRPADFADEVLRAIAGPHITEDALAEQRAAMERVPANALRSTIDCLITYDSRARLHEIAAPTLVMVGDLDAETPVDYARALSNGISGAKLVVVPDAGHLLNVEAPQRVNELLRMHITSAEESA